MKTQERCYWKCSDVFIVNFEHISNLFLKPLLLALNKQLLFGYPYNAWCPQNGQTHAKYRAANTTRFLTCVWPFVDSSHHRLRLALGHSKICFNSQSNVYALVIYILSPNHVSAYVTSIKRWNRSKKRLKQVFVTSNFQKGQ